jgi:hypothetical protein
MPPTVLPRDQQILRHQAAVANTVRALVSQQQQDFATNDGQIAFRTGVLQQYPSSGSPTNYTSGYGLEVLSDGLGTAPVARAGVISWTSPGGGTKTVVGLAFFDNTGLLRVLWSSAGAQVFDTSGNLIGYVPYFNANAFVGEITF